MPSSCMQSVQKGEKAYSDGRIAVPDDDILQHRQHFPMARKYHCCSRNDTFIASGSTKKSTSPLQLHPPHPYFRASRSHREKQEESVNSRPLPHSSIPQGIKKASLSEAFHLPKEALYNIFLCSSVHEGGASRRSEAEDPITAASSSACRNSSV